MSAIPGLKKKLKSVKATGKLSKAMKTVSAAKLSRLSAKFRYFSEYSRQFRFRCEASEGLAPDAVVVLGSNRGFCGGFNTSLVSYVKETMPGVSGVIACGDKLIRTVGESGISIVKTFSFPDVPDFPIVPLFLNISQDFQTGRVSAFACFIPDMRIQWFRRLFMRILYLEKGKCPLMTTITCGFRIRTA